MTLNSVEIYQYKVETFIDNYEALVQNVLEQLGKFVFSIIDTTKAVLFAVLQIVDNASLFARYSTYPLHYIQIYLYLRKLLRKHDELPIFKTGAHYIYGRPGSGKSTMTYHAMMDYAYRTSKCSYTTEMMELPRVGIDGKEYYYHQQFEPSIFYQSGEQIAGFDSDRFNMVVYEEMLTKYQQRNNKSAAYNDEFLPMIASMGTQRHQGIDLFYFISQLPRNDISIMQMLVGYHEPKVKKAFDYKYWLRTGKYRFYIKGWKIKSYEVEIVSSYEYKLKPVGSYFYENVYRADMEYFNRLNMKSGFEKLPIAKGMVMS
ncbi:MAG: hypothetical protein RBQ91_02155 [Acholeplasma sp.]|nr:hypothetical protein [Acholeplasma sp.]